MGGVGGLGLGQGRGGVRMGRVLQEVGLVAGLGGCGKGRTGEEG